jgi:hypothetical protein
MNNIYKYASINKLRFQSPKGPIATESLYDLPISSTNPSDVTIVSLSETVFAEQDKAPKRSLLSAEAPVNPELDIKIEILQDVLQYKQDQAAAKQNQAANTSRIAELKDQLAKNSKTALGKLSNKAIEKELKALQDS